MSKKKKNIILENIKLITFGVSDMTQIMKKKRIGF